MMNGWQTVSLGEFLTQRKEFFTINDFTRYKRARVQLHGRGIVLRDEVDGVEVKTKEQQAARTGEFLVAEIDAKVGGFGIVPPELGGVIVSSHYFLFEINEQKCLSEWLDWFIRSGMLEDQVTARGSTNYSAIRPSHVLKFKIPLPQLTEQRYIVARIEALATRIAEAQSLRREAEREVDALVDSTISKIIQDNKSKWAFGVLPEFVEVNPSRKGKISLEQDDIVSFVPMSAVDDITGTIARPQQKTFQEVSKGYTWFIDGDVIFARITPCMENGKSAIARNMLNGTGFGSTEFHVIRAGNSILAEWIYLLTRSIEFRNDAADHFKGTAGQQRVPQSFLDNKVIPVPSLEDQRRLVTYLDEIQAKVSALRAAQEESARGLEALMPSILDKAFKGEL